MYAQIAFFDGPRSPELVAAAERAGRDRVMPAVHADPQVAAEHIATYVLRQPDGAEAVIMISNTLAGLQRTREVIMGTELLPGEDEALLPGPDRVEQYTVAHAEHSGDLAKVAS